MNGSNAGATAPQGSRERRRRELERRLKNARARLNRAERDVEALEGELSELNEQDSLDLIRSWGGVPDWSVLLQPNRGMCLYMLAGFLLERIGLREPMGVSAATNQFGVTIGVAAKKDPGAAADYVNRIRQSIEMLVPFIRPHEDGLLRFQVAGANIEDCALELRVSPDLATAKLVCLVFGRVVEEIAFDGGLGEALFYIQEMHPGYDVFEDPRDPATAPGDSGEALRAAIEAFVEGARQAGRPVPWATAIAGLEGATVDA